MNASPFASITLTVAMLAVFALVGGAVFLFRRRQDRKRAWLMLVAAIVLFGNVLIWAWPMPSA